MRAAATALLSALAIGFFSAPPLLREKGGDDRTGPYDASRTSRSRWRSPGLAKTGTAENAENAEKLSLRSLRAPRLGVRHG